MAADYYDKSCQLYESNGCFHLGEAFLKGEGVKQSKERAKNYFEKACLMGSKRGCDVYKKLELSDAFHGSI